MEVNRYSKRSSNTDMTNTGSVVFHNRNRSWGEKKSAKIAYIDLRKSS